MSLPAIFNTTLSTIPSVAGYLRCERTFVRDKAPALRVGIVWAGSPTHKRDRTRSLPLAVLRPLLNLPGIQWVSLQKGPPSAQLTESGVDDAAFLRIEDATAEFHDYADTAAAINRLDLVISVDTSVAHLAGAMGKPVWVLLPKQLPDWRWLLERKDSPWYKSARLFRQKTAGDWAGVVITLREELRKLLDAKPKQAEFPS